MSAQRQSKQRVVIVGLGDSGLLTATELAHSFDVIGVSPKPCLLSGQELGLRLCAPERWKQHYRLDFDRFVKLDSVRRIHAKVQSIQVAQKEVTVERADGSTEQLSYDALVIASGVTNGFWREPSLESLAAVDEKLRADHLRVAKAQQIAVIGAGVTGVASAANIAATWPEKSVHLYLKGGTPLPGYHEKTRKKVEQRLRDLGVHLHPEHSAVIPDAFELQEMTSGPVQWSSGQAPGHFDLVLWTVGRLRPNSAFAPASMKNEPGWIRVDAQLRVPGHPDVFAVGDIADTDPLRCSARNWGHRIVAHNVEMALSGRAEKMKSFEPAPLRWGSIFGAQANGLEIYSPTGRRVRVPGWLVESLLFPIFVDRMIYGGLRKLE